MLLHAKMLKGTEAKEAIEFLSLVIFQLERGGAGTVDTPMFRGGVSV